jgi:hypothetical protein
MKQLVVLNAGLSNPSSTRLLSEQLAAAVSAQVSKRGEGLETQIININEYTSDLAAVFTTGVYSKRLQATMEQISAADGLIAATPVFSASYSGVFKLFMDVLDPKSLLGMPVLIAATAGSPRHSLVLEYAMRPLFAYLQTKVVPTGVFAATDDFGSDSELNNRIVRAATEMAEYLVDVKDSVKGFGPDYSQTKQRSSNTQVSDNVTPFANLLKGHDGS